MTCKLDPSVAAISRGVLVYFVFIDTFECGYL